MNKETKQQMIEAIESLMEQNHGLVKAEKLYTLGLTYRQIQGLVHSGVLYHVKNGYYSIHFEERSQEEIILGMFPDGILTMETALYFYRYLENPPEVWSIALSKNISKSRLKIDYPKVYPYYTEPDVMNLGVSEIPFAGGMMKIYSKERLICDCLKYEERMSREAAKRALMAYINEPQKDLGLLMDYARERKVTAKVHNRIGVWL